MEKVLVPLPMWPHPGRGPGFGEAKGRSWLASWAEQAKPANGARERTPQGAGLPSRTGVPAGCPLLLLAQITACPIAGGPSPSLRPAYKVILSRVGTVPALFPTPLMLPVPWLRARSELKSSVLHTGWLQGGLFYLEKDKQSQSKISPNSRWVIGM